MVHRISVSPHVFVYDGESRGSYRVSHAQSPADGCRECCLACSHRGEKGYKRVVPDLFEEFRCCSVEVFRTSDDDFVFHAANIGSLSENVLLVQKSVACSLRYVLRQDVLRSGQISYSTCQLYYA